MSPITPETLRQALPLIILAAVILAAGVASVLLGSLKSRDPLLLWLGLFASLYGLRLFIANPLVLFAATPAEAPLHPAASIITYLIPIPCILFFRELIGRGSRNLTRGWLWAQLVFTPVAIAVGVFGGHESLMSTGNNILIIAGSLLALVQLFFFYSAESGAVIMKSAFVFFLACVVLTNIGSVGPLLEPIGFLVFVLGLGYTAALRTLNREKQFIAVEHELATARRIQSSILPKSTPNLAGLEIATRYVPMTSVAGDFYEFLIIDPRRITILVADVSGHGVPAALIASMLKVGVAAERHNARNPAAILTGLNSMLRGVLDGQFVTAACAFLDLEAHTLTYSGAGHPPAILARKGGADVLELEENGLFLGPFAKATYSNLTVPFDCGDKLLLYTDGIIEATLAGGQPFGGDGIKHFAAQHHAAPVSTFAENLIQAVSGPSQEDDLTVVVAEAV